MKRTDLTIVSVVGLLGLIAAFWFVVLSPKRDEAKTLGDRVSELEAAAEEAEATATAAEAAREDYDENYRRMVVLGKAVPDDADTPSLLVELQSIAGKAKVSFDSIALSGDPAAAETAPATTTPPPPPAGEGEAAPAGEAEATPAASTGDTATAPAAASAPATEAAAATLPIGATVGPAGLPVMPYEMTFSGGFFEIADFMKGVDGLIRSNDAGSGVRGRLLTVEGFSLTPLDESAPGAGPNPDPRLSAAVSVTSYLTPAEEGLTAGATPGAPPPAAATPTPASATTPAPTGTP
jgi:Tfp pilus assembly protein PilO